MSTCKFSICQAGFVCPCCKHPIRSHGIGFSNGNCAESLSFLMPVNPDIPGDKAPWSAPPTSKTASTRLALPFFGKKKRGSNCQPNWAVTGKKSLFLSTRKQQFPKISEEKFLTILFTRFSLCLFMNQTLTKVKMKAESEHSNFSGGRRSHYPVFSVHPFRVVPGLLKTEFPVEYIFWMQISSN